MELGNLSIRLGIDSTVKQQLDAMQKELDAFKEKNKKTILKVKVDVDGVTGLDKIKAKVKRTMEDVKINAKLDKEKFQRRLNNYSPKVTVTPTLKKGKGGGTPMGTADIVANRQVLLSSIKAALSGQEFPVQAVVKGMKTTGLEVPGKAQKSVSVYREAWNNVKNELNSTRNLISSINTIWAASAAARNIITIGGALQQQDKALRNLIGSETLQLNLTRQIEAMAVKSPLSLMDMNAGAKQLLAYGVQTNEVAKTLKNLSDIAAGTGVSLDRLTLAYGQTMSKGFLRGDEMRQFTEAGVGLPKALSDYYTKLEGKIVSVSEVYDRMSKRMISSSDVANVLDEITGKGGKFFNAAASQADTLAGAWSNLKDKIDLMYKGIANMGEGPLKGFIDLLGALIENWRVWLPLLEAGTAAAMAHKLIMAGLFVFYKMIPAILTQLNILHTSSAAAKGADAAATVGLTTATKAQTAAQSASNKIMAAAKWVNWATAIIGVMTAIWGAVAAYRSAQKEKKKYTEASEAQAEIDRIMAEDTDNLVGKFLNLSSQYKALGKNLKAQKQFIDDNAGAFKDLGLKINDVAGAQRLLVEQAPAVIKALQTMQLANAYLKYGQQSSDKWVELELKKGRLRKERDRNLKKVKDPHTLMMSPTDYSEFNDNSNVVLKGFLGHEPSASVYSITDSYNDKINAIAGEQQAILNNNNEINKKGLELKEQAKAALDELNKGSGKSGNGGNGGGGDREDKKLKEIKARIDNIKEFISEYERLKELYGKAKAYEKVAAQWKLNGLPNPLEVKGQKNPAGPGNIYQRGIYQTNRYNAMLPGSTPERRNAKRDMNKQVLDYRMTLDTMEFESQAERASKWLDKLTKQYEDFKAIAEKTGDEGLASRLVFGEDGVTQAKEYFDIISKLSGVMESLGVKESIPMVLSMSDAEIDEKYPGKGQYEAMRNLAKRLKELNEERVKDENDTLAELLSSNQDFAEKMAAIYAKEQKQLSLVRKDSLREKPVLSKEQSNRVVNTIQENANKERSTLIWNNFTGSEYYKQMFDDLDNYSTKALENLREHLLRVREEAGNLNPQDLKAYIDALNKLEDKLGDRKPFKSLDLAIDRYQDYKGVPGKRRKRMNPFQTMLAAAKAYRDLNKDINSLTEKQGELLRTNAVRYEAMQEAIKEAKAAQEALNSAYEKAAKNIGLRKNDDGSYSNAQGDTVATKTTELKNITVIGENKSVKEAEKAYKEKADSAAFATNEYEKSNKALGENTKYLSDAEAAQHNISKAVQQTINKIVEWGDAVASVAGDLSSMFDTLGNSGLADVMSETQGIATGASNIGKAMASFATGNFLGGVTGAVSGITGIISTIAQAHDKKLDRDIERSQERVERLKNEYSALQRVIDRQLGAQTSQQTNQQLDNLKKQREELQGQMRDEDAKKKTDQGKMEDYRNSIAELDDQIKYYTTDLAKSLYDIDIKSWASEFGDALFEAWKKGENGADAFRTKANDILGQLANNVLKKTVMEKAFKGLNDYLFGSDGKGGVFADGDLSNEEIEGAAGEFAKAQNSVTDYFNNLDKINEVLKAKYGYNMKDTDNNDTSLSAGIKNITEETADILAAYLNAIRADVSVMRSVQTDWNGKLTELSETFRQANFVEMGRSLSAQTAYLQQVAENSRLLLDVQRESRDAVVSVNSMVKKMTNGTERLYVKM